MLPGVRWEGNTIYYYFVTSDSNVRGYVDTCVPVWNSGLDAKLVKGTSGICVDSVSDAGAGWEGLTQLSKPGPYVINAYLWMNTTLMYKYKDGGSWVSYPLGRTRSIVYHELGHALCLDEDWYAYSNAVMHPYTTERALTPTDQDKRYVNNTY